MPVAPDRPASWYLGPLGPAGVTAYVGLLEVWRLQRNDAVYVSAATGGVGHLVTQMANARGHRVVASAGAPEKVELLRSLLGAAACFSHRDGPVLDSLRAAAPDGIDLYFDNVGGDHLAAALRLMRPNGRIVLCGQISRYGGRGDAFDLDMFEAVAKGLTLRGFLARSFADRRHVVIDAMSRLIDSGAVRPIETVGHGLAALPQAFESMLEGRTIGKALVTMNGGSTGMAHTEGAFDLDDLDTRLRSPELAD